MTTSPRQRLITAPFVLATVTVFLGAKVPNLFVLAPRFLAQELGFDEQQIGLVMSAFNIAALMAMVVFGRIIERVGWRGPLTVAGLIAAAGCVAFARPGSVGWYIAARAAQGVGFAGVLVGVTSYVAEISPRDRLAQALGFAGVLTLVSQAVGPAVGELLEARVGWDWVFYAGGIGAVLSGLLSLSLPPVRVAHEPAVDRRRPLRAVIPLLATGIAGFGFGTVWTFLAHYASTVELPRITPFFGPYVAAAISTRVFFGHLADRIGRVRTALPALIAQGLALGGLSMLGETWHLVTAGVAFGLAHGLYYPTLQALVVERSSNVARSRAIAASTFAFGSGIAVSAILLGGVAKAYGYPAIYVVAGIASLGAAGLLAVDSQT